MAMPISAPIPPRSLWTVADLERLPDDGNRYEILHGELLVTPLPAAWHQRIAFRLAGEFAQWCKQVPGWECFSPGGVYIDQTSWLEPDFSVQKLPASGPVADWRDMQPPALVIEILSPSTRNTDRHRKRPAYLAHGVDAVWLVDIDAKSVERWTAQSEFPELHSTTIAWAPAGGAPALTIELAELFA